MILHNLNDIGFVTSARSKETLKLEKPNKLILTHEVDLSALMEVNKVWRQVSYEDTVWGATTALTKHRRVQVSHNKMELAHARFQVGGTAMMMFGELTFRIYSNPT